MSELICDFKNSRSDRIRSNMIKSNPPPEKKQSTCTLPLREALFDQIHKFASRPVEIDPEMSALQWLKFMAHELPSIVDAELWEKMVLSEMELPKDFNEFIDAKDLIHLLNQQKLNALNKEEDWCQTASFSKANGEEFLLDELATVLLCKMFERFCNKETNRDRNLFSLLVLCQMQRTR